MRIVRPGFRPGQAVAPRGLGREKFVFGQVCRYARGMIAVAANPFADYMTVQDAKKAINARSHSTVLLLLHDEESGDPAPAGRPLAAIKIPGLGWMIRRTSVAAFLAREAREGRGPGFPRGRSRKPEASAKKSAGRSRKA